MRKQNLLIFLLGMVMIIISCSKKEPNGVVTPDGILLNNNTLSLTVGQSATLAATLTPTDAVGIVTWSSDNPEIAAVDDQGVVTAVANGTAIITATAGTLSANCTVTVTGEEEEEEVVDLNLASITYGGVSLAGFQANVTSYDVMLAEGTTDVPQVVATAVATDATEVTVTQANALPGTATILVAEKGNTANTKTYTINFTVEAGSGPGAGGDCSGTSTEAREGEFTAGYTYSFKTESNGDVTFEIELLDQQIGLVGFIQFNEPGTPDFREEGTYHPFEGQKFTQTFTPDTGTTVIKLAWKFAWAGSMAVTKIFEYTIGDECD